MQQNPLIRPIKKALQTARQAVKVTTSAVRAKSTRTQVYIGLNDGDTKKQRFDTDRYVSIMKRVCAQYGTPFSFNIMAGGYVHDNGEYTEETTIVITFIDVPQKTVNEIAEDLCVFFRQESVLITTSRIKTQQVHRVTEA